MRYDPINWDNVHRTQEGNPQRHENEQVQYWQQQLADINQKLANLEYVSLTEPEYCRLLEEYRATKQEVHEELEKLWQEDELIRLREAGLN